MQPQSTSSISVQCEHEPPNPDLDFDLEQALRMLACKPCPGINNYQKLVGKLIYLTHTRPDISYVVHVLSQFMHAPLQSHLKLAFRVLRYLKTAPGKGISFNKGSDLNLRVYVDSDWAKCKVTRKSVTGYVVFMGESLVSWKSKKQSMLSKSSAEAEYRAMNSVTCEVMWILKILAELKVNTSLPVPLHCDNSSAIQIAANPVFHERTKHFEIELFFLREKVANGIVKTVKIKSADNSADIFTKGLSVVDHNKFCEYLGLTDLYRIGLRGNIENIKPNPVLRTNDESKQKTKGVQMVHVQFPLHIGAGCETSCLYWIAVNCMLWICCGFVIGGFVLSVYLFVLFAQSVIMVEGEKPPKDKGQASSSEEDKIDQYDPLFLHSNDTSGVPLINFKLEGTKNYKVWKTALTIAIHTKNKLGFLNGKLVRPSEEGFMQEQWDRCNSVVLNWILGCVSQDVFMGQVFSKNAKVVWDELEETYSKQDGSVIFNMHYKIHSLSQSGSSLSEYYHKFNALWRQYDSLVNLPDCVCENSDKLKEHNQLIKLMQFLMGLDEVYAPIRSIILTSDPLPDVRGAFATLSRDESHRGSQSSSTSKTGNSAFVARPNTRNTSNWNNNNNNNQSRRLNRPNLVCTHCNMNGHTADRCFELIGYPPSFKKNNNNGFNKNASSSNSVSGSKDHSTSNSFTDDQFKKLMALISDKSGSSSMPANIAGINCVISFCSSRFFNHNSNIRSYKLYVGWIIDSGASQHMTYTVLNMFNLVEVSDLNMTVGHPNGTKAMVTHMGSLRLTDQIVIHDVLVVPGYEVGLLSMHRLSKDNKFRVIFDDNACVIQDSVQRTQVGTGSESNGLYFLNTGKRLVNNNIEVCCLSKCIWHNRLGHPADQVLSILKNKLDFEKDNTDNVCDVCHKAKQTREPFHLSEHKSKALGQLVHLDVWGPYKVQSKEGYKYFLTVVDDFTRVVWVFLLKGKDEVFLHIVIFYNLVKNQFDKTIKVFRSDNGTEFINQNMDKFCKEKGILHQTSCPYTPQQNGVAERKHRHLLNVGRALMFQGGIPLNMWTECILTAVYLINRLPSSVLSGKSPYELVFNREPSLSHLKTFGCLCFSTVLNDSDKFSSRSEKSVFIGYSNDKKGYKLFSLENKKVFYSRDVKFYETVFPFKNSSVCKEYQMVFGDKNSLNFFNCDEDESKSSEPYDDRRDKESEIGEGTDHMSSGGTENTGNTRRDEGGHPDDSEPAEAVSDIEESETLVESDKESEGDDSFYQEFNEMFEIPSVIPDSQSEVNLRRSSRKTSVPKKFSDFKLDSKVKYSIDKHVNYSSLSVENFNFSTNLNKIVEPKTFDEASKDIRWIEAMNLEMEALNRNGTWVITELPVGRKPIGNKWVWKVKYKSTGDVERFKARLVAKGYNQKEGIDYDETFSPVVKIVTVRCILSLAVFNNWSVYQLDINNAFLYGDLEEDVYMSLPEGYFAKDDKRVCKLVKSLYGLKQAPRKWNEKLTSVLLENEFTQSKSDFSLFTKSKNGIVIVLLVYVDDIVITVMSADSAVTYTSVHSEARSWSIPSEDPYEEAARQLLEQPPHSPEYVPEDHVPVYILEPEHPEDLVPAKDEAPIPPLSPSFLALRIRPLSPRALEVEIRDIASAFYHSLHPSGTPPSLPIPLPAP
ncbi:putative RNA-directed DNA polymerase, partial [Tanacetum coccineum]